MAYEKCLEESYIKEPTNSKLVNCERCPGLSVSDHGPLSSKGRGCKETGGLPANFSFVCG